MRQRIYLILLLLIPILLLFSSTHSKLSINSQKSTSDIPEMKDILSSDQAIQLKAARRLVERVGVEKALEILEHSALPHTGEGHLVVHQIGFYAYQKYGTDAILKCKDYFLYACYHGAIIEAASARGFEGITSMTDKCKSSTSRYFQCTHAAGHAILAIWNYDLPDALKTCDQLYEKETDFPEALSSCHNGVFMENLFGVHNWGRDKEVKRKWLSADPFFPCNGFGGKYQQGCWLNQASRIYQISNGNLVKTSQTCQQIGNDQYFFWCMDGLFRQIHALTSGDINKVFSLCSLLGEKWKANCIGVNALSYYSVGDSDSAIAICKRIDSSAKMSCYQGIIRQIIDRNVCLKMELEFKEKCLVLTNI